MSGLVTKEERRAERRAEAFRRRVAACIAVASTMIASFVLVGASLPRLVGPATAQPLLAMLLALALVSGFRSLDGPIQSERRRRSDGGGSRAGAALTLWLGCFAAIWAALFASDLSARLVASPDRPPTARDDLRGGGTALTHGADGRRAATASSGRPTGGARAIDPR